ncbi:Polyprenyl synthetase [uncultured delta proteobacterium]|uniref:Polyprenyl synthetase n=1 Tax=uncultured delta proteobacterium TaxID=34034 RepID=A0A212JV84_9DELT|nr:Polyprenyl synthetase [uncultured delta proteobacterium]
MLSLVSVLREEQPRINAVLEKEIAALPASARDVARHTLAAGGKRLRPMLAVTMGRLFGCDHPDIYAMAAAIEFLHVASLLHDDVLDNATTRRGIVAAHTVYTPTVAILGGDVMLAHAAGMVAKLGDSFISIQFAEAVSQTAVGEIDEFNNLGDVMLPYEKYLAIITGKTAWNLRIACELPAHRAGAGEEQVKAAAAFGQELGLAFQIVDDALDIAPSKDTGKPSGGDLRERKCTPLTRFYMDSLPENEAKAFAEKFKTGSFTEAEIEAIIRTMREKGMDKQTRDLAEPHLARAKEALAKLPANKERKILEQVPDFIKTRGN